MDTLWQDFRYALRSLARSRAFTVLAIATTALGIGANSAIFSVVNSVLLRPLPYANPSRLVMVWERNTARNRDRNVVNPGNYLDWRDRASSFSGMAGLSFASTTFTGDNPEIVSGRAVTGNFFSVMGVHPVMGREFTAADAQPNAAPVIILSDGLWRRRFGADRAIVGRTVPIAGGSAEIIGVMPPGFEPLPYGDGDEYWEAWHLDESNRIRHGRFAVVIGRLKDGVALEQAQAEMNRITAGLEGEYPDFDTGWSANVVPLAEQVVGQSRRVLWMLLGAVSLVLLIACANVGNLVLVRASGRQREQAVRTALGAPRSRIVRQWLAESLLVSLAGGAAGLLLASWGVDLLVRLAPAGVPRVGEIRLDTTVLVVTLLVAVLVGVAFGLPAALGGLPALSQGLHSSTTRTTSSGAVTRFRGGLVIVQVSLALVLLAGAGLLVRSIGRLTAVDPGFDPANLGTVAIHLPSETYREPAKVAAFSDDLLQRVRRMPGVQAASLVTWLPMCGACGAATSFTIVGRPEPAAGQSPVADIRIIDASYFNVMRIALRRGRVFTSADAAGAPSAVVISETLARQLFANEDPIGQRLKISWSHPDSASEVVGVVADVRYHGFDGDVRPMIYFAQAQEPSGFFSVVYRAAGDPLAVAPMIRTTVREMDRNLPVGEVATMYRRLADSVADRRYPMMLLSLFAGLALLLAAIGLYGVLSYTVGQRTQEIGVRMALGARPGDVLRMVVRGGLGLAAGGVALGILAGAFATRALGKLLYDVPALDPLTFAAVAMLLLGVAALACLLPARRAARIDPMVALRSE